MIGLHILDLKILVVLFRYIDKHPVKNNYLFDEFGVQPSLNYFLRATSIILIINNLIISNIKKSLEGNTHFS